MKIAEALILRADCQKRIVQLKARLNMSCKVQEGDLPPENVSDLLAEIERVSKELELLVQRINRTNSQTQLADGLTVSDALATRDVLVLKRNVYSELAQTATVRQDRFTRTEVKYLSTVNVSDIQNIVDDLSRKFRQLDSMIQATNWSIDLVD